MIRSDAFVGLLPGADTLGGVRRFAVVATLGAFLLGSVAPPALAQEDRWGTAADQIETSLKVGILALALALRAGKSWLRDDHDREVETDKPKIQKAINALSGHHGDIEDARKLLIALVQQQMNQATLTAWCKKHEPEMRQALKQLEILEVHLKKLQVEDATIKKMRTDANRAAEAFVEASAECP